MYVHNLDGDEHSFSLDEYLAFYGQKFTGEQQADLYQAEDDHWLSFNAQNTDGSPYTWTPQINAAFMRTIHRPERVLALSPGRTGIWQ